MKWTDVLDITMVLIDKYPSVDPQMIMFTDLHRWVMEIPDFNDEPNRCNERILEAIQQAWIEETN